MSSMTRQLECLSCSNTRTFVHHTTAGEHRVDQATVTALPRRAVLTCGRCGSVSLVAGWGDSFPYRAPETILPCHRRPDGVGVASSSRSANGLGTATSWLPGQRAAGERYSASSRRLVLPVAPECSLQASPVVSPERQRRPRDHRAGLLSPE